MSFGRPPHFTPDQDVELGRRYQNGESTFVLAAEAGVSRKAVENALKRRGIERRNRSEAQALASARRRKAQVRHPNYRGKPVDVGGGYLAVSVLDSDPMVSMAYDRRPSSGYVLEHRLVMARHLGRPLLPEETVHHKNGKRDDNRLANLELWSSRHAKGQRVEDLRAFAKEILDLYPD